MEDYNERIVLFMDILGTEGAIKNGKIEQLEECIDFFLSHNSKTENKNLCETYSFSDHLVMSREITPEMAANPSMYFHALVRFFESAAFVHITLLKKGFLVRGAITKGLLKHKQNKIFGQALVKAAKMEANEAIYPRVIIQDEVLVLWNQLLDGLQMPSDKKEEDRNLLKHDGQNLNGGFFVNYFEMYSAFHWYDEEGFPGDSGIITNIIISNLNLHASSYRANSDCKKGKQPFEKWLWLGREFSNALSYWATQELYSHLTNDIINIKKEFDKKFEQFSNLYLKPNEICYAE